MFSPSNLSFLMQIRIRQKINPEAAILITIIPSSAVIIFIFFYNSQGSGYIPAAPETGGGLPCAG